MKFPFFKSLLVAGALLLAWNCTDNTSVNPANGLPALAEEARMLATPDGYLYITEDGLVKDGHGTVVAQLDENGTFAYGDNEYTIDPNELEKVELIQTEEGSLVAINQDNQALDAVDGNVIGQKNDDGTITNQNGAVIVDLNGGDNNDSGENGGNGNGEGHQTSYSSTSNGNNNNPSGNSSTSNGNNNNPSGNSSTSNGNNNTTTSTASGNNCEGQCYDAPSGKCVDYRQEIVLSNGVKYAYSHSCELDCYWDPNKNNCRDVANATPSSSASNQQTQSSTSHQQTPSSTSQQSGSCPNIEYVNGGHTGSGYATRYWDGCKPSCSWRENASKNGGIGTPAKQCNSNGKTPNTDYNAQSVCQNGGSAATCTSQVPFTVSGCDNIGFAFAAVPAADGAACGKCFELTFTGEGNWETKANHQALRGKKLIVMVSNVGWDVQGGQFDIMIPGGGVGIFNGTAGYNWGDDLGAQSGGLLSDCENSVGYDDAGILERRKNCLIQKCNSTFANDSEAKSGCLFLANFMEAAGNPKHSYKEVKCPSVLSTKY